VIGFDALQVPSLAQYALLRSLGFEVAMGYTRVWTQDAVGAAKSVDLAVLPIIEKGQPTSLEYFRDLDTARRQGAEFRDWADRVGMPRLFPFMETVDFDCPVDAVELVILPYVNTLIDAVGGRNALWLYGPHDVIATAALEWPGVAGLMQAYAPAWSQGRNATPLAYADSWQVKNGLEVYGVQIDLQRFATAAALWR